MTIRTEVKLASSRTVTNTEELISKLSDAQRKFFASSVQEYERNEVSISDRDNHLSALTSLPLCLSVKERFI